MTNLTGATFLDKVFNGNITITCLLMQRLLILPQTIASLKTIKNLAKSQPPNIPVIQSSYHHHHVNGRGLKQCSCPPSVPAASQGKEWLLFWPVAEHCRQVFHGKGNTTADKCHMDSERELSRSVINPDTQIGIRWNHSSQQGYASVHFTDFTHSPNN